ncbi:MAG: 50S ribosomal protein L29 [Clostridia bacterium]|nr:50S ribosomal protein L29 [Clostridia bacterium]MBQ2940432.1 50S ribosomal protein L29 [Clostridia bacterium]MBQ5740102.1 50S ribosomal protein L29 [Oscillospiraceae bacterium]
MKKTELAKLRELSNEELGNKLEELKSELFRLRFQNALNQLENPMRLKAVRKEIATVKMLQRQNELNSAEA